MYSLHAIDVNPVWTFNFNVRKNEGEEIVSLKLQHMCVNVCIDERIETGKKIATGINVDESKSNE